MIKFFLFLKKIHFLLLFIILEWVAIHYYAHTTSYRKVKIVTASNHLVGGVYAQIAGLNTYFHLREENQELISELVALKNERDGYLLPAVEDSVQVSPDDSLWLFTQGVRRYEYTQARVVNNSITRQENYITLNKGEAEGLLPNMAIVAGGGIAGYVLGCSDHFAVCMSVLNRNFKTSGRIKGNEYFGSVFWDGVSYEHLVLSEIPKYAPVRVGDTIVTTDYSSIFPPDVIIGTVESFELKNATYYDVRVKLHSKVAALGNVMVVNYLDTGEKQTLEEQIINPNAY